MNDIDDRSTSDTYVFRRYGVVMSVTLTLILTNIAAFTNYPVNGSSTVYVNKTIDTNLTKENITNTLRSHKDSLFYFIDVKDYGCRSNDSLLNYVILKGRLSPSFRAVTSQPQIFAKDLTVKFCPNLGGANASYSVSFLFSSGCNDDVIEECRLDSPCYLKLDRHLPLCDLCNEDVTLEWRSFIRIQDTTKRTVVIALFKNQAILK